MSESEPFDPNPYAAPASAETVSHGEQDGSLQQLRRLKRRQLVWILLLFAVYGLIYGLGGMKDDSEPLLDIPVGLLFTVLVYRWCEFDRLELGNRRWRLFAFLMIICPGPVIILPAYLIASRGWRGLVAVSLSLGMFASMIVVFTIFAFVGALLSGNQPF